VYPGPDCRGSLYLDDGVSFGYRKGAFARLPFSCTEAADAVTVQAGPTEGAFAPWFSSVTFAIHGAKSKPKQVAADGKPVRSFAYDAARKLVTVTVPYARAGEAVTVSY